MNDLEQTAIERLKTASSFSLKLYKVPLLIAYSDCVPVVRCKDCIYTRKLYGRLVCKYGTCSGRILREDFFCANGTRKEENSDETDR